MPSKKKRITKRLGASALTIATLASGLSFGGTAVAAPDAEVASADVVAQEARSGSGAESKGTRAYYPGYRPTGINLWTNANGWGYTGQCYHPASSGGCYLIDDGPGYNWYNWGYGETRTIHIRSQWTFDGFTHYGDFVSVNVTRPNSVLTAEGGFRSSINERAYIFGKADPGATVTVTGGGSTTANAQGGYSIDVAPPNAGGSRKFTVNSGNRSADVTLNYGAAVSITNPNNNSSLPSGTTTIEGRGQNGASVSVAINDKVLPEVTVKGGTWSVQGQLVDGRNTIVATQKSKGRNTTTSRVVVDSEQSFSADWEFQGARDEKSVISGKGKPNSVIAVVDGSNNQVAAARTGADGNYSVEIDAPNKGGVYSLTVVQTDADGNETRKNVELDYGTAVHITTPGDKTEQDTGPVTISGDGENGSAVMVSINGRALPETTVANGKWTVEGELRRGENTIQATQRSKGATTTVSTVVVNPGESTIAPLVIETPANGSTVETPSNRIEFAGSADPESRVVIKTETGRTIVDAFADRDGKWSKLGENLQFGVEYRLITEYTPQGESTVTGEHRVTLKDSDPGVVQDARIDTPAAESTVIAPDGLVDFAGVGTTGTKVTIYPMRGLERVVGTAIVGKDGTWTILNGELNADNGEYNVHVRYVLPNGQTIDQDRHFFIKRTEGVVQDPRIDTPAAESTVIAPDGLVDFTGVGTTGTKVTIYPTRGLDRVVGTAVVEKDGTWTTSGTLNADNGEYNIHVQYTLPNGQVIDQDRHFFIKREASTSRPFTTQTPREGETVVLNNSRTLVEGTGTTGGTVKVWNWKTKDRIVIEGREVLTVDEDGKWSGIGEFAAQRYELYIEYFAPGVDTDGAPTQVITRAFTAIAPAAK